MISKLLRRSGVAVVGVSDLLGWHPDIIVQVGVGRYCQEVNVMRETWPGVSFIGFEPHPETVKGLRDSYPGELHECAIADKPGRRKLFFRPRHKDGSSLFPHPTDQGKSLCEVDVIVSTLDGACCLPRGCGQILLWLDCEGSELRALQGGEEFVEKVGIINLEMTGNPPNPEWGDHVETHNWLMGHGFLRQTIHTNRSTRGQYDAIYVRPSIFRPELCCCPSTIRASR